MEIGARTQFVNSAGLDPFSTNDVLPQLSLGASFGFWNRDQLSLAAVAGFDYGSTSASLLTGVRMLISRSTAAAITSTR